MKIYLDLDGVIANFTKGACKALKMEYPKKYEFKEWDEMFRDVPKGIFYTLIHGHDFWANLEMYPYANKMVDMVDRVSNGNWEFLTKPMIDPGCMSGKHAWVEKHFRKHIGKLNIINGSKAKCCTSALDVLIDDAPKNIGEWAAKGGLAIRWLEKTDDFDKEWFDMKVDFVELFLTERKDPIQV